MAVKSAVYDYSLYTPDYYLKGFLAGGVCCSVTSSRRRASARGASCMIPRVRSTPSPRCTQPAAPRRIGGLTAGQFAIFDSMLPAIGIDKFHYHEPHAEH